uniref:Uncharacterized protein n=1 Tax=Hyaloperonospora arabidopsidis (strain Emoy2) TaxID=559515 RepID=M4BJ50_HYAAE
MGTFLRGNVLIFACEVTRDVVTIDEVLSLRIDPLVNHRCDMCSSKTVVVVSYHLEYEAAVNVCADRSRVGQSCGGSVLV